MKTDPQASSPNPLNDMTCQEFVALVTEYLENSLGPATRDRFERHLIECPECPFYLRQMQEIIEAVGILHENDISPRAREVLHSRFRSWKVEPG